MIRCWMKGVFDAPDGESCLRSHRMGKAEGKRQKAGVARQTRHEGLAPVRLFIGLETGSGPFAGEFLPDIGSIGLSLSQEVPVPGLTCPGSVDGAVPFSRSCSFAAARSGQRGPCARDHEKRRQPLTSLERPEELECKTKKTTYEPMRTGSADAARGLIQGGKGRKK